MGAKIKENLRGFAGDLAGDALDREHAGDRRLPAIVEAPPSELEAGKGAAACL